MEKYLPYSLLEDSLLVVAASVFRQICQAIFAEISYLSSSVCDNLCIRSCVVSECVTPAPCAVRVIALVS